LQFGKIDGVAIKAEAKDEKCYEKTRQNDAPAGIA
jgi:hypothetical protein